MFTAAPGRNSRSTDARLAVAAIRPAALPPPAGSATFGQLPTINLLPGDDLSVALLLACIRSTVLRKESIMNAIGPHQTINMQDFDIGYIFSGGSRRFVERPLGPAVVGTLMAAALAVRSRWASSRRSWPTGWRRCRSAGTTTAAGPMAASFSSSTGFWSYFGAALVLVVLIGLASLTIIGVLLLATIWSTSSRSSSTAAWGSARRWARAPHRRGAGFWSTSPW